MLSTNEGRISYDSRIRGGRSDEGDTIYTFSPGLTFNRDAGYITLASRAGLRFNRYAHADGYDSDDFYSGLDFSIPTEAGLGFQGGTAFNYDERTDLDVDAGERLRTKTARISLNGQTAVTRKAWFLFDGGWSDTRQSMFVNRTQWFGSAGIRYDNFLYGTSLTTRYRRVETDSEDVATGATSLDEYSDSYTVDLSRPIFESITGTVGVGYREVSRTMDDEPDTGRWNYNASIQGPFLPPRMFPKLESRFTIAYQDNEAPGLGDQGGREVTGSLQVAWQARVRTRWNISVDRGFELTARDYTVLRTQYQFGVDQQIGEFITSNASLSWETSEYEGLSRDDATFRAKAGLNYSISRYWSTGVTYRYEDNESDESLLDFTRHVTSVYLNFVF